jgi:uncharacterized protein (DUF58 family)
MTPRPTRVTRSLLALVAWAVFLGVLSARPEPFLVAVPLLVALAGAGLAVRGDEYALTHEITTDRLFEGERVTVTVTLRARAPIPLIELVEPLPPLATLVEGVPRAAFSLGPGEEARWTYTLRCDARARFVLGALEIRFRDRAGLWLCPARHQDPKVVGVYPRTVPLRRVPRPLRTQTAVGNYVSPALGEGLEPGEIRPFAPGDRIKHVNWRASLRLRTLYVTQYHQERNADIVLMLDTLSEVGLPGATTLDLGARAAASLAAAYLARKDRVGLIEYGGTFRWVKPAAGRAQYARLLESLLRAQVLVTYVTRALDLVPPRVLPPQALVVAISPLLDDRFVKATTDLAARGFDVVVLAVSPIEPFRAVMRASPTFDLAARLWALERRAQLAALRRRGLLILEWNPPESLEAVLAPLTGGRRRLAIAG